MGGVTTERPATVEAGYPLLGEDARDGDRGSRRRDDRREPRLERSPAHSLGWGKSGGWRPLAKRLRPAAWAPPEADRRVPDPVRWSGLSAGARLRRGLAGFRCAAGGRHIGC